MMLPKPGAIHVDALLPPDIARRAEAEGVKKASLDAVRTLTLAFMAGNFIGLGALFSTLALAGTDELLSIGLGRILFGLSFCLGPILVIVGGAELFTSNNLIIMAWANHKISTRRLLRNWVLVYLGNFTGAVVVAAIIFFSRQYTFWDGAVGHTALLIASHKVNLDFFQAVVLGMMCNVLVCLAAWLAMGARTTTDKILAIVFPITMFMAAGFEQSIANMFFISFGLLIHTFDPAFTASQGLQVANLNLGGFVHNLIPVTIGNIIGGGGMVSLMYWFVYLRGHHDEHHNEHHDRAEGH